MGLLWLAIGCIWCITIVGIPMGLQCFQVCGIYSAHYWKKIMWREQQFCAILKCEYMFEDRGLEIHDRRIQRLYYSYKKDTGKRGGL